MLRNLTRAIAALALLVLAAGAGLRAEPLTIDAGGQVHEFDIDVARSAAERARGLMFRKELAPDYGMLFDFGREAEVTMWMKNTFVPLDMLFVRADGTIHRIAQRTTPFSTETIASRGPVQAVLELPGGTTARLGIEPGHSVRHAMFGNAD